MSVLEECERIAMEKAGGFKQYIKHGNCAS